MYGFTDHYGIEKELKALGFFLEDANSPAIGKSLLMFQKKYEAFVLKDYGPGYPRMNDLIILLRKED